LYFAVPERTNLLARLGQRQIERPLDVSAGYVSNKEHESCLRFAIDTDGFTALRHRQRLGVVELLGIAGNTALRSIFKRG
jgi:hypothetical protein